MNQRIGRKQREKLIELGVLIPKICPTTKATYHELGTIGELIEWIAEQWDMVGHSGLLDAISGRIYSIGLQTNELVDALFELIVNIKETDHE